MNTQQGSASARTSSSKTLAGVASSAVVKAQK
jgi:hypothetical protein